MSIVGNRIVAPVSMADVRHVLGASASSTLADLCTHPNINRWSRNKPVRYPKITPLATVSGTGDQRRGNSADISQGIVYGLRCRPDVQYYSGIHLCAYDYEGRPSGGASEPYRLSDFAGYDHGATLDVAGVGIIPASPSGTSRLELMVSVVDRGYDSQSPSLSLRDFAANNTSAQTLMQYYPCVMVGDYVHVMYNSYLSDMSNVVTAIAHNGAQYSEFFIDLSGAPSAVRGDGDKVVSFFLAQRYYYPVLSIDFSDWVNVSGIVRESNDIVALPGAVALSMTIDSTSGAGTLSMGITASSAGVTVSLYGDSADGGEYSFSVSATYNGRTATRSMTKSAGQRFDGMVAIFAWSQFGLATAPTSGTVSGSCYVMQNGNRVTLCTASASF